ncbi:hypothetical protein ABPG77_005520 [Micractinium sp. CCAP 211/92]
MSALVARRALSLVRALGAAGARAEHTAAATGSGALQEASIPTKDPIMLPFYEKIAGMQMHPAAGPHESSPSETACELELFRIHNSSLAPVYEGHMIKATVLEISRRTVTLDTGLKPARVARADLPPDCVIGSVRPPSAPRKPGQLMVGDVVQVFLEDAGTPEGDFFVSGVQAAVQRRLAAVWNELEERKERGEMVKGRILNAVWSGYAVGVAGIVAFLPASQCTRPTARRIGYSQKFKILDVDRARGSLVLQDPHLLAPQPVSFARKPAKTEEDVVRRRELARVADELRSVLALRGPAGKGNFSGAAGKASGKSLSGGGGRLTALAAKPPGSSSSDGSSSSSSSSDAS